MPTKIEWCQETWNVITGCTKISEGCQNCYAERMAKRLAGRYGYPESPNQFSPTFHRDRCMIPHNWIKPRIIFVCSMGDIFHEYVDPWWIDTILDACIESPQHTYLFLTKRPDNIKKKLEGCNGQQLDLMATKAWLGVTAENQQRADERIPILLTIPAAVRFVSVEPMLGGVNLTNLFKMSGCKIHCPSDYNECRALSGDCRKAYDTRTIDWVIVGGESGSSASPMHPDWARSLRDQCGAAGVPFFFKQWGSWCPIAAPRKDYKGAWMMLHKSGRTYLTNSWNDAMGANGEWYAFEHMRKDLSGNLLDGQVWNQFQV